MNTPASPLPPKKRMHRMRRLMRWGLGILSGGLLLLALLVLALWILTPPAPSYDELRAAYHTSDTVLLDRNGVTLHRLRVDFNVRQGPWVALADISPAMLQAVIIAEDKDFESHYGVDLGAALAALWFNATGSGPRRGASTITMQLASLWDEQLSVRGGRRGLWQKMQQAMTALLIEQSWSKDQILEAYLNMVPFRGELVGIDALAQGLFGKTPSGLNAREAAVAAALIRGPNASEVTVTRRACGVLRAMNAPNAEDECAMLADFIRVRFSLPRQTPSEGIAPHLARRLLTVSAANAAADKPLAVRTTVDAQVQRIALESLRRHLLEIAEQNVADGAVLVIDNATGEVIAWVGSSGSDISSADEIDAITAMRQPGSTLKPFLYALAIEQKRLTAASLLNDSPLNLNVGGALYVPQNYDKNYKGWISVRTALASSLNIPAVRTIVMLGADTFSRTLLSLGLPLKESGDYYGYSLALGSAEVTLLTLTNAFRALANGGEVSSVRWLPTPLEPQSNSSVYALEIPTHASTISAPTAWIIGSILSDREARVPTFGLDSELNTRYWSAVKTGTSKDMRDNWAIGYSRRYTVGVWVGNASGAAMWGVSGTSGAAPVWRDVMNFLYQRDVDNGHTTDWIAATPPQSVVTRHIRFEPPIEPERTEWFLEGTERSVIKAAVSVLRPQQAAAADAPGRILTPVSGTIIALDPDIPPANQRLWLRSNLEQVRWQIGDVVIGSGANVSWLPIPGRHRITLVSAQSGDVLDSIALEVRGASLAANRTAATAP